MIQYLTESFAKAESKVSKNYFLSFKSKPCRISALKIVKRVTNKEFI